MNQNLYELEAELNESGWKRNVKKRFREYQAEKRNKSFVYSDRLKNKKNWIILRMKLWELAQALPWSKQKVGIQKTMFGLC